MERLTKGLKMGELSVISSGTNVGKSTENLAYFKQVVTDAAKKVLKTEDEKVQMESAFGIAGLIHLQDKRIKEQRDMIEKLCNTIFTTGLPADVIETWLEGRKMITKGLI